MKQIPHLFLEKDHAMEFTHRIPAIDIKKVTLTLKSEKTGQVKVGRRKLLNYVREVINKWPISSENFTVGSPKLFC